jgi:hypothetical protein
MAILGCATSVSICAIVDLCGTVRFAVCFFETCNSSSAVRVSMLEFYNLEVTTIHIETTICGRFPQLATAESGLHECELLRYIDESTPTSVIDVRERQ